MYSGEYDACDVTMSIYPHRASLKDMPDHGGNRTYDLLNTSPIHLIVRKYMFLREFWTNIRSSNNELNLFGNLLASDGNIGLANF
jgi:hypothetical protein